MPKMEFTKQTWQDACQFAQEQDLMFSLLAHNSAHDFSVFSRDYKDNNVYWRGLAHYLKIVYDQHPRMSFDLMLKIQRGDGEFKDKREMMMMQEMAKKMSEAGNKDIVIGSYDKIHDLLLLDHYRTGDLMESYEGKTGDSLVRWLPYEMLIREYQRLTDTELTC